jgi:hypothetical protein
MQVVLALNGFYEYESDDFARGFLYLTTEIAKSGTGGWVFLYGVFGLYTLKKWA